MSNIHKDHVASCLCCTYLSATPETQDFSEVTPGYPARITCDENCFKYDLPIDLKLLRILHDTGSNCVKFKAKEEHA